MAKNKKDPGPTEKKLDWKHLYETVSKQDARNRGMAEAHDAYSNSISRLRHSLEDVWAIEYSGVITPEKKARIAELTFAIDTLTTLDEIFQGEYDEKLDKLDSEIEHGEDYEFRNPS